MIFDAEEIPVEKLPKVKGWRILIGHVKVKEQTDGGILLVDESIKTAEYFREIGKVLAMGDECYMHSKFQGGISIEDRIPEPWCKVGDVISFNMLTGRTITVKYGDNIYKLRYINDDEVMAVLDDPSLVEFV